MPIIGYAEMLEEELGEEDKKRESTAAIIRNAKRLQRLADDILDVTRIETNTLHIDKEQHKSERSNFKCVRRHSDKYKRRGVARWSC